MIKRNYCFLFICLILFLLSNMAYAEIIGTYEVGDFSNYNRDLVLGNDIDAGDIIAIDGFNTLQLSGDNEFVRTEGDLAGFTNGSDWSLDDHNAKQISFLVLGFFYAR